MNEIPAAPQAEQHVLGALLVRNEALAEVADWLPANAFLPKNHQLIYTAILDLEAKGKPFDAVTLADWFQANGLSEIVPWAYVGELANASSGSANIASYAEIVLEKSRLRQAMDAGAKLAELAAKPNVRSQDAIAEAMASLAALSTDTRASGPVAVKVAIRDWYAELQHRYDTKERMSGVVTPWQEVNDLTQGWQPGQLIVLAGRSNMGKSLLGYQAVSFAAIRGTRGAVFSLEMSRNQVIGRMIASNGEIPHEGLRDPTRMDEAHWPRVTNAIELLHSAPLCVDDSAGITAQQIVARAKREHLRQKLGLVLIDHLHDVRRPGKNPVEELGDAARAFKALAKDLNCPVLLIAQLNRANQARTDHRPTLTDLRASGEIEQIADLVLFAHREDYYNPASHMAGALELIVGKGRDLPTGQTILLKNRFGMMRADDWEGAPPEPPQAQKRERGMPTRRYGNIGADRVAA